ncbi:hypothetical protein P7C70_g4644, partial [Phenoliferia sp. Uapishka_3]
MYPTTEFSILPRRFPPEIIAHIIHLALPSLHVTTPLQPRYDLLSKFCLVSHTWREISQPLLLTYIEFTPARSRLEKLIQTETRMGAMSSMLEKAEFVRVGRSGTGGGYFSFREAEWSWLTEKCPRIATIWLEHAAGPMMEHLCAFKNLKFLHFGGCATWFINFDKNACLPTLEHLSLATSAGVELDSLLKITISVFPKLKCLTILGAQFIDSTFPTSPTPLTRAISTLVFMGDIRNEARVQLPILALFPYVRKLRLGRWVQEIPFPARIRALPEISLEDLTLEWHCATDAEIVEGLGERSLANLKRLRVSYYEEHDEVENEDLVRVRKECAQRGIEFVECWWSADEKAQKGSYYWV